MLTFNEADSSPVSKMVNKPQQGTIVSVREIHKNSRSIQTSFKKYRENHYDNAIAILNEYSMILKNVELELTNEFIARKGDQQRK